MHGHWAWAAIAATACNGDVPVVITDPLGPTTDSGLPSTTEPSGPTTGASGDVLGPRSASGTRLQARTIGEPGSADRTFSHFYDTQLDVPCAFVTAADEVLRCLPIVDRRFANPTFVDARCQTETSTFECGDVPYSVVRAPAERDDECDPFVLLTEVYELVPALAPNGLFEVDPVDGCRPYPGQTPLVAAEPGATVPPETFVAATVKERISEQGFGVRELVADDGARARLGLFHTTDGPCAVRYLADLGPRCLPDDHALVGAGPGLDWWWADAYCQGDQLAYRARSSCPRGPARVGIAFESPDATTSVRLYDLDEPSTASEVYDNVTGQCSRTAEADTPWTFYPVTGPSPARRLAPLSLVTVAGDRLDTLRFEDEFGLHVSEGFVEGRFGRSGGGPFVQASGEPCSPFLTEDGQARCLGSDVFFEDESSVRTFGDAACETPIVAVFPGFEAPTALATLSYASCGIDAPREAGVLTALRSVEDEVAVSTLYQRPPGQTGCRAVAPEPTAAYLRVGPDVLTLLPALTVEPAPTEH